MNYLYINIYFALLGSGLHSFNQSPMPSPRPSYLPSITKKRHSPVLSESVPNQMENSPLILTYAKMHQLLSPSPDKLLTQKSLPAYPKQEEKQKSILHHPISNYQRTNILHQSTFNEKRKSVYVQAISNDKRKLTSVQSMSETKRNSVAVVNSKLSPMPRESISSSTTLPTLSPSPERRLSTNQCVRLGSAQLRRLRVSDKYMNEAKKLYFNAPCRSFIPRVAIV